MTSRDNDLESSSGAYALHALGEDEARAFEDYLATSEQTRNEVVELSDTAVLLGLAVEPVAPPASLKAGIMAQLASTPQLPPVAAAEQPGAPSRSAGPAQARARARWFSRPLTAVAGVAAAVALIVGGSVIVSSIATTASQNQAADRLAAINAAEDSQRTVAPITGGGTATLVWSASLKTAALMVDGMSSLPAGKVYELWYIDGSGARSAGTFTVGESGSTWRVLDGQMGSGDKVGVTIEPSGGSTVPSGTPIVLLAGA